jgi:hypothetical protein
MSYKRSHDELEYEPTIPKRKLDEIQFISNESQLNETQSQQQSQQSTHLSPEECSKSSNFEEFMDCDQSCEENVTNNKNVDKTEVEEEEEDDYDTDPDIIIPYLHRFEDSYQSSLSIYSSRLDKLELSDALKCTNDLFVVAIDNYEKEHNHFTHQIQIDLSGIHNVRREFDRLLIGNKSRLNFDDSNHKFWLNSSPNQTNTYVCFDDKLSKVIAFMCQIENKICSDVKKIYLNYEKLLESLVMIEYRLGIIIEMFHHMTDIEPQKFLPSLPYIQNVPDLIGYINSLYDEENELNIKDESTNERMQAIVNQFRAMHKRIRDAMDGLHALSCIIMEKKTEVIDRVHTFYKKAEQIFFSEPSFMFQTKDSPSRCL